MFEATLKSKLKSIFDFDKVTFDIPGESQEQEGVFIEVESARPKVSDKRQLCRVTGKIHVFAQLDKLPYGYFMKCIDSATASNKQGLHFFNFEENKGTFRNITERSMGFIYLFDSQYDPNLGTITSVETSYGENLE